MARPVRRCAIVGAFGLALAGCGDSSTGPAQDPPTILLAASELAFAAPQGGSGSAPQTVAISNSGGGPITYSGASGWLSASLDKTIAPTTLTLAANPGNLTSGSYTATVPISSGAAGNSPQAITVTFLVLSGGATTTLSAAGQSVVFLDSPNLGTQLTLQAGSQYLIAVVNTAATHSVTEDFRLAGALVEHVFVLLVVAEDAADFHEVLPEQP